MGIKGAVCPQGKYQSPCRKTETKLYKVLPKEDFQLLKNKIQKLIASYLWNTVIFFIFPSSSPFPSSNFHVDIDSLFTISNNPGSDQNGMKKGADMYKFHACYSPRHVPNSSLILRAWLLINLGEKRKVRVGCEAPGPGELVAASMSHASVMLGLEEAQCCLAGPKSAVMAATVRKEEVTVLVLRVTHVYFQDLHPGDLTGNLEAKPTKPKTHHLSP